MINIIELSSIGPNTSLISLLLKCEEAEMVGVGETCRALFCLFPVTTGSRMLIAHPLHDITNSERLVLSSQTEKAFQQVSGSNTVGHFSGQVVSHC